MSKLQAAILAAGKGTRMGGDRPKVLFEAGGKTLIEWVLSALSVAGVDDCVAIVGFRKEEVIAKLPTGVRWAEQSPQLGTGHAMRCARNAFLDDAEAILVACGDMPLVTAVTYKTLVMARSAADAACAVLTVPITRESRFGRVVRDKAGDVLKIVEYKDASQEELAIEEGNAGVYCFKPAVLWSALEEIKNNNSQSEYYLPDVIPVMLGRGERVISEKAEKPEEALGVNTPQDLRIVEDALAARGKDRR